MNTRKTLTAAVALLALAAPARAALQFEYLPPTAYQPAGVGLTGEIEAGDKDRLLAFINTGLPGNAARIVYVSLSSAGGNFAESLKIAALIHANGLWTYVGSKKVCASACFFIFAGGSHREINETAKIGVHRNSVGGVETTDTKAWSVEGAQVLAQYGIPPAAIGKLIITAADAGAWLSTPDLAGADPLIQTATASAAAPPAPSTPAVATAPVPPYTPTAPTALACPLGACANVTWQAGFADGQRIHAWVEALPDDQRHGAYYWASVRSVPEKAAQGCTAPFVADAALTTRRAGDAADGCIMAKGMFASADSRRTHEPDYKAGWNQFWSTVP